GLCFCTGSYGASAENDVPAMAEKFADSIHFLHLRNVQRESNRSFHESNHLVGSVDMYSVMKSAVLEQQNREYAIPYRPDHGHKILDDMQRKTNAGYPAIGRLKGLSELRGLQLGIQHSI
ncbi:MAG: mannonate dehydratase, partial [Saprospiraceae bacterium]|nr:mannonate dehydratase [Saprospiraceae bacterium]